VGVGGWGVSVGVGRTGVSVGVGRTGVSVGVGGTGVSVGVGVGVKVLVGFGEIWASAVNKGETMPGRTAAIKRSPMSISSKVFGFIFSPSELSGSRLITLKRRYVAEESRLRLLLCHGVLAVRWWWVGKSLLDMTPW
jgi:hypothetical protein